MISVVNFRGFHGSDPLDRLSAVPRYLLTSLVGIGLSLALLSVVFGPLNIATLRWNWLMYAEAIGLGLIYVPIVTAFRKSTSLLPIVLLLASLYPLDFFVQAHYRDVGKVALWTYNADGPLGGLAPMLQFLVVWVGDALVAGCITLWVSRVIASLFTRSTPENEAAYRNLFREEWTSEAVAKPHHDFAFYLLRSVGLVYAVYLGITLLGALGTSPFPEPLRNMVRMTYENTTLAINTYIKLVLMLGLAMTGAYNDKLRYHTSIVLLFGHAVSTVGSLGFYLYDAPTTPYRDFLLTSAIVDSVLCIFFAWIAWHHRNEANEYKIRKEYPEYYSLANRLTVTFFYVFGTIVGCIVLGVLGLRLFADSSTGWGAVYGFPDPQVCNTLTKYATLSFLSFTIARRELLRSKLYATIVAGYATSVIASSIWLLIPGMFSSIDIATRNGGSTTLDWYFMLNVVMDGGVVAIMLGLRRMYYNMEYSITALSPAGAQCVLAVHSALHNSDAEFDAAVLQSVDRHAAGIRGRKRGLLNFPYTLLELLPTLLALRPGFSIMSSVEQRYVLRQSVLRQPAEQQRAFIPELADLLFKLGNACHALVTLAHYNHIRSREETSFVPADARDRLQGELASAPPPFTAPAGLPSDPQSPLNFRPDTPAATKLVAPRVVTPLAERAIPNEVDYLIIGSGAGGAVMAYRLACAEPSARIVVIERGPRYSPLQDFNDDEMEMVRKLYKEGGLQQTKRFDLMILQGECMGGTTVINNSVCFPMPESIRKNWQQEYDIDLSSLDAHYAKIASEIDIETIAPSGINERVEQVFRRGIEGLNQETGSTMTTETLKANHRNMVGDGLCNIGNKRMRKRSMLETYIPWAEARGVEFLSETSAVQFFGKGRRAEEVLLRSDLGHTQRVKVRKSIVVAGGVIASSHFLMRSGLRKNVGERLACNFAFPVALEFEQELKAFDGVQITLGAIDAQSRAIFETYFNPPGSFAISLPFYFDEHSSIMQRYSHMVNFGALVGSEANGTLDPKADVLNGRAFSWDLGQQDRENITYALSTLARIAQNAGATRIALPLEPGIRLDTRKPNEVDQFCAAIAKYPLQMSDLRLTTAHPQGGNGMAGDNSRHRDARVVDSHFRVEGYDNLYIADASIFPTGITVNPQWTIMALSSMAAEEIVNPKARTTSVQSLRLTTKTLPWVFNKKKVRA